MCADWDGPDVKRAQSCEADETWVIICHVKGGRRMDWDLISQLVKMSHGDVIHSSSITVRSGASRLGFTQKAINLSSHFHLLQKTSPFKSPKLLVSYCICGFADTRLTVACWKLSCGCLGSFNTVKPELYSEFLCVCVSHIWAIWL